MNDLKFLLRQVKNKIDIAKEFHKHYGQETAPNFNSFDFWHIDENKVSEILAFLLNPKGKHSQGIVYLEHFLKMFLPNFFEKEELPLLEVKREFQTNNRRRIDVVIFSKRFDKAIGIENKIYTRTEDQQNQVIDYIKYLEAETKAFALLYLCPQNKEISNESIKVADRNFYGTRNKLKRITYEEDLIKCIEEFSKLTMNYRVKSFIQDFQLALKRMYMGNDTMNTEKLISKLITENTENLKLSFQISKSLTQVKNQLKNEFKNQIFEIGNELGLDNTTDYRLKPSKWEHHKIIFSFEQGGILFGLIRDEVDKGKSRLPEIEEKLVELTGNKFNVSEWWPMWQVMYAQIEKNENFWLDIKSGELKKKVCKIVEIINNEFNSDKY